MRISVQRVEDGGYRWRVLVGEELIARGWEETEERARAEGQTWVDAHADDLRRLLLRPVPS